MFCAVTFDSDVFCYVMIQELKKIKYMKKWPQTEKKKQMNAVKNSERDCWHRVSKPDLSNKLLHLRVHHCNLAQTRCGSKRDGNLAQTV